MDKQCWENCKYSVASDGGDEMAKMLRQYGLCEGYNCNNEEVIGLEIFPSMRVSDTDGSNTLVSRLFQVRVPGELSEDEQKEAKKVVNEALRACNLCGFHKPKD